MSLSLSEVIGFKKEVRSAPIDPNLPLQDEYIGVEVEVEGAAYISVSQTYWKTVRDGSLRDEGKEFVFKEPLFNGDIGAALDELQEAFDQHAPRLSDRCSVHVHINVSNMSTVQLHRMLLLYLIFERTIVRYHSDREDNIFAVPFYKAPFYVHQIDALYREDYDDIADLFSNMNKYQALNLRTVREYGSLEFRHMGGTADTQAIYEWIKIIMMLKKYVMENDFNPTALLHNMSGMGPENFLIDVFGRELSEVLTNEHVERDIIKGVRLAQLSSINTDLAGASTRLLRRRFTTGVLERINRAIGIDEPIRNEFEGINFDVYGPVEGDL
jgi:hypothetical protein